MDAVVNQLARELAEAISAAVADDARVEAIREKGRVAGFDLRVSLEAIIGFVNRSQGNTPAKVAVSRRQAAQNRLPLDITANDRRFLKSLRISADETTGKEAD
jgi:enoyl-CoA hydratase/carnithine racemase